MTAFNSFLSWLDGEHDRIMDCEHRALEALNNGNTDEYRKLMRQKAEMLANIADAAKPYAAGLSPALAGKVLHVLQNFAGSAATSLQLNSIFYMSALLYRDDHKPGEPDNLEVFIRSLKENFSGGSND